MANNKRKKVTVGEVETIAKNSYEREHSVEWNGVSINVKHSLDFYKSLEFVNDIVQNCFNEETGLYMPEFADIIARRNIVAMYSNVNLPGDTERMHDILYNTDLVDVVAENANSLQIDNLVSSAMQKIEHLKSERISLSNKKLEDIMNQFDELYDAFSDIITFASEEDVEKMSKFIDENGEINYDELIKSYSNIKLKSNEGDDNGDVQLGEHRSESAEGDR